MKHRKKKIKKASWAGIFGNGFLAVIKIWFGTIGGSAALVGAGIGPSVLEIAVLLGKQETLNRLQAGIENIKR